MRFAPLPVNMKSWFLPSFAALVALCICGPCLASSTGHAVGGKISEGMAPFSETFQQMLDRDAQDKAGAGWVGYLPLVRPSPAGQLPSIGPAFHRGRFSLVSATQVGTASVPGIAESFRTISLQDQIDLFGEGIHPPNTNGAIGPDHFMMVINGSVAIFSRGGTLLSHVSLPSFFSQSVNGTSYPRNGAYDPRVIYDRRSRRWYATALEWGEPRSTANHLMFAVSRSSNPLNGLWDKYVIPVGVPTSGSISYFSDYATLGTDDNGVYFGVRIFPSVGFTRAKIVATAKASLIDPSPSLSAVFQWDEIENMQSTPQPPLNIDGAPPNGKAWFVTSSDVLLSDIHYRTLVWAGDTPLLSETEVKTTPDFGPVVNAPALGSQINIHTFEHRLQMAFMRNGRLWTCRNIGVNSSGGAAGADRVGCEFIELDVTGNTPVLVQTGRVYDASPSNPRFYYYPSLAVNGQGHVAMGFSGSSVNEYVGAYVCMRTADDPLGTMGPVIQLKEGEASYQRLDARARNRWGDYSYTSIDPDDDMSFWTTQEYASSAAANIWATWTARLLAPPPTLDDPAAVFQPGTSGATLNLTGTGLFDSGTGFDNRLGVDISGGNPGGIGNYSVLWNSPTSVSVTFDIAGNASPGSRNITLTNPDGQSATVFGGLVVAGDLGIVEHPASAVRCTGEAVQFCVTAYGEDLEYQWTKDGLEIPLAQSACYQIAACTEQDSGAYACLVKSGSDSISTTPAVLEVAPCVSIPMAKQLPDGARTSIRLKPVSASYPAAFYIQEPEVPAGLRVESPQPPADQGTFVDAAGTMLTGESGERYLQAALVISGGDGSVMPLSIGTAALGGGDFSYIPLSGAGQRGITGAIGLNNIGLLVSVAGRVTSSVGQEIYVDDGRGIDDGSGNAGVKVALPAEASPPAVGSYVRVTGTASCSNNGGIIRRLLIARSASDILVID